MAVFRLTDHTVLHQPYRCNEPGVLRGSLNANQPAQTQERFNVEQLGGNKAKVTLEPFERGYGHTLGNALRRVLLLVDGGLCTQRKSLSLAYSMSSRRLMVSKKTLVNIMLNLKGVVFKLHNRDEVTLSPAQRWRRPVVTAGGYSNAARC